MHAVVVNNQIHPRPGLAPSCSTPPLQHCQGSCNQPSEPMDMIDFYPDRQVVFFFSYTTLNIYYPQVLPIPDAPVAQRNYDRRKLEVACDVLDVLGRRTQAHACAQPSVKGGL